MHKRARTLADEPDDGAASLERAAHSRDPHEPRLASMDARRLMRRVAAELRR